MPSKWFIDFKSQRPYRMGKKRKRYGITKKCPCGTQFFVDAYSLHNLEQICCSLECRNKYQEHGNKGKRHSYKTRNNLSAIRLKKFKAGELCFKRETHPGWRGGTTKGDNRVLVTPGFEHPYADKAGRVEQHRLIVENVLGRFLKPYEIVHHRDKNGYNNSNNNLILCTQGYHMSLHAKMRKGGG